MKLTSEQIDEILKDTTGTYDPVLKHLLKEATGGNREFLNFINDHSVEFDDGLSPRMRNWYDEKGLLISKRNVDNRGKRRLSFLSRLWFQLAITAKDNNMDFDEIIKIKDFLLFKDNNKYGISPFELYALTATCMLNEDVYYLSLEVDEECPFVVEKEGSGESKKTINLSRLIREVLSQLKDEEKRGAEINNFLVKLAQLIGRERRILNISDKPIVDFTVQDKKVNHICNDQRTKDCAL